MIRSANSHPPLQPLRGRLHRLLLVFAALCIGLSGAALAAVALLVLGELFGALKTPVLEALFLARQ